MVGSEIGTENLSPRKSFVHEILRAQVEFSQNRPQKPIKKKTETVQLVEMNHVKRTLHRLSLEYPWSKWFPVTKGSLDRTLVVANWIKQMMLLWFTVFLLQRFSFCVEITTICFLLFLRIHISGLPLRAEGAYQVWPQLELVSFHVFLPLRKNELRKCCSLRFQWQSNSLLKRSNGKFSSVFSNLSWSETDLDFSQNPGKCQKSYEHYALASLFLLCAPDFEDSYS